MKNIIMVDLDSDREQQIKITKPKEMVEGIGNETTAKEMVLTDITTLCNALGTLIQVGDENQYFKGEDLAKLTIKYFKDNFLTENTNEEK